MGNYGIILITKQQGDGINEIRYASTWKHNKRFCLIAAVTQATSRGGEEDIYSEISSIMTGIYLLPTYSKITDYLIY